MKHRLGNRRMLSALSLAVTATLALGACGSGFEGDDEASEPSGELSILIGSSGDAETQAVQDAVAAWSEESGVEAEVTVASDLAQQLSQGFASNNPPDLFYVSTDQLAGYVSNGSLYAYGDDLSNAGDFLPTLVDAFTVDDEFVCAPKDFSTLGLVINTKLWKDAGLTDADIPTTWEELATVSKQLTQGKQVGLALSPEYARVGAFFPQAGGAMTNEDGTEATVDSPENLEALDLRPGPDEGRGGGVLLRPGRRLGRRGVRQAAVRDDHRGQLDRRGDERRLPGRRLHRGRAAAGSRGARARSRSRTAGALRRRAATRRTPWTSSSTSPARSSSSRSPTPSA